MPMPRRGFLTFLSLLFLFGGATQFASMVVARDAPEKAEAHPLIAGCENIPEAVTLAGYLDQRNDRLEKYLIELDEKQAAINAAEERLAGLLTEYHSGATSPAAKQAADSAAREDDIRRLIAIYDVMKPASAAGIFSKLPPDYAADILLRLGSESSAGVIAALDPETAAIVTAHMGARSMARN